MYNGLVLLGRVQYIQLSHVCLSLMSLKFRWLLKTLSVLNHEVLIKLQENLLKQEGP